LRRLLHSVRGFGLGFSVDLPVSIRGITQSVNISLALNTSVTNRLMPDSYTDALIFSERPFAEAIRGRLIALNVLLFKSVVRRCVTSY
jgi:hypothetical protein